MTLQTYRNFLTYLVIKTQTVLEPKLQECSQVTVLGGQEKKRAM